jgi:carboxypeptidase C (cathepsin A)
MFFWFFEARKDPANAPLSLWLQGGPGVPSITAALGENGPCIVTSDSKNTTLNPWSWNNEVNMLYIDQPVDVGFSYRSLVNGTINQLVSPVNVVVEDFSASRVPAVNSTFLIGTFASQNIATTLNTTETAAVAMWHFLQTWSQE